jgi:hypothetical protein
MAIPIRADTETFAVAPLTFPFAEPEGTPAPAVTETAAAVPVTLAPPGEATVASSIVHSVHQFSALAPNVNGEPPIDVPAGPTLADEDADAALTPDPLLTSCRWVLPDGTPVMLPPKLTAMGPR